METKTNRDLIEEQLHAVGVHDGFPTQRRAMAVALDVQGIAPADVELLAKAIAVQRRKDSDSVPAILAKLLGDPKATRHRIDDIKRGAELRASQAVDTYPGKSLWKTPGADDGLGPDIARSRRVAYALIVVERKDPSVAAEVLGCTHDEARRYADEHLQEVQEERARRAARARPESTPGTPF